jgi:hypothetical protein
MKRGRYNIQLREDFIKKFNVYINDYGNLFIYFEGDYVMIERYKRYKGGWLWKLKDLEVE